MNYDYEKMVEDMKAIQHVWLEWFNGRELSEKDFTQFTEALERLRELHEAIPNEVGVK